MTPHGGDTMEEQYQYTGDQGMQLPAQGTVLDACYNLTGDVMATASAEVVQNQDVGCVQVCMGSCAVLCHLLSSADNCFGLVSDIACCTSQVWGVEQNGWRLLHTMKVRIALTARKATSCVTMMKCWPTSRHQLAQVMC
jgi:hypothetical protein